MTTNEAENMLELLGFNHIDNLSLQKKIEYTREIIALVKDNNYSMSELSSRLQINTTRLESLLLGRVSGFTLVRLERIITQLKSNQLLQIHISA